MAWWWIVLLTLLGLAALVLILALTLGGVIAGSLTPTKWDT